MIFRLTHRLERTAGTEEYARQVSDLLEEIAEPAHFKLRSLPNENSIPDGRYSPSGYPLWYKDPYKMPLVFSWLLRHPIYPIADGIARVTGKSDRLWNRNGIFLH